MNDYTHKFYARLADDLHEGKLTVWLEMLGYRFDGSGHLMLLAFGCFALIALAVAICNFGLLIKYLGGL